VLQPNRGWTDEEWSLAVERLRARGLMAVDGENLTDAGAEVRKQVEDDTDRIADQPWRVIGSEQSERLAQLLEPLAKTILVSGVIPQQNPMGLPTS
jgi:hypothetical protein